MIQLSDKAFFWKHSLQKRDACVPENSYIVIIWSCDGFYINRVFIAPKLFKDKDLN